MISITCTHCQTVLEIDDAFAGGVCRCQHCGTIQTVPSHLKGGIRPQPYVNPSGTQAKALYQNEAAARTGGGNFASTEAGPTGGLDDLAQIVASSSGLSGSGLHHTKATAAALRTPPSASESPPVQYATPGQDDSRKKSPLMLILVGAGALVLLLVALVIFLLVGRSTSRSTGTGGGSGGTTVSGPNFCGETLTTPSIVYVLDDANSIANDFDPLKAAVYQSISSLGENTKFAVILWDNGEAFSFPGDGLAPATSSQLDDLRSKLQDVQATGESHLRGALERALARNPGAIMLATAKTSLSEDDEAAIASAKENAGSRIKFYNFTIGSGADNSVLKMAATGSYKHLSSQELRAATP